MLGEIKPKAIVQGYLFQRSSANTDKAMAVLDRINAKFGRGTVKSAAEGIDKRWRMRRERMSPAYTTAWDGLMVAKVIIAFISNMYKSGEKVLTENDVVKAVY